MISKPQTSLVVLILHGSCFTCCVADSAKAQEQLKTTPVAATAATQVLPDPGPAEDPGPSEVPQSTEFVFPPHLHPWQRLAPGAWRRFAVTTQSFDVAGKPSSRTTTVQEDMLAAAEGPKYTIRTRATVEALGRTLAGEWVDAAFAPELDVPGEILAERRLSDEAIDIGGESVPCQVWDIEYERAGRRMRDRLWFTETKFPYVLMRRRAPTEDSSPDVASESEAIEVLADDMPHEVAGRTLNCVYVRTIRQGPKGRSVEMALASPETPGGRVAAWTTEWDAEGRRTQSSVMTTLDYAPRGEADPPPSRRELRQQRRRLR